MATKVITDTFPDDHPIHRLAPHVNTGDNGQFKPKLTFEERCAMLACIRVGVSVGIVAAAFGVHRRTAGAIAYQHHRSYQAVRDEEHRLGAAEFQKTYITESVLARIEMAKPAKVEPTAQPRQASSSHSGLHSIKTDGTNYAHRVEVEWRDNEKGGQGWGWRDLDGDFPDFWVMENDVGFHSSRAAFDDAKANIVDLG